jgi:hypothetical protein
LRLPSRRLGRETPRRLRALSVGGQSRSAATTCQGVAYAPRAQGRMTGFFSNFDVIVAF